MQQLEENKNESLFLTQFTPVKSDFIALFMGDFDLMF